MIFEHEHFLAIILIAQKQEKGNFLCKILQDRLFEIKKKEEVEKEW